jgi:uncharacterized membrane protein
MDTSHFHPMVVHFPIALLITGFVFDLIGVFFRKEKCLSRTGMYLMIIGTIGAVAGYLTGEYFTREMTGYAGEIKEEHEFYSKITMYTMIVVSTLRIWVIVLKKSESFWNWIILLLYFLGVNAVGYAGFLGGKLVYNILIVFQ